ncbi:hypothetical protein [uncultured Clostridium sp.]|uniref:hypothetical protein n=1 Tax=uncultured Clostridium sp. TaxID=59620 RepID=UPI00262F96F9|nr:hypothetical protein [uncultured Clostridium sp.]
MEKEKVKLDEVLKFLFSTSNKVLVKLLNGIFDEKFDVDEVELTVSNNEFVEDDLGILRGDMFFDILNKNHNKASYHIEFQTKNDNTMIVRMFEYGFKKGKEQLKNSKKFKEEIKTIYFPKQKVIFFEENKSIKNQLKLKIIFPDEQEIIYTVDVIKYWEYTDKELKEKKMYPLMPLQLFNLRKELEKAHNKNDLKKIKELSKKAKNLAEKLAKESAQLFEEDEILGEDFHKMLLAIQNLIEYLNRNYMKDENIENEVNKMTKTLYDPEVEKRGIEKGIKQGIEQGREQGIKSAIEKMLLKGMKETDVANILDTDISLVKEILKKIN